MTLLGLQLVWVQITADSPLKLVFRLDNQQLKDFTKDSFETVPTEIVLIPNMEASSKQFLI